MNDGLLPGWTMNDPIIKTIDPRLLEMDKNRARINPYLNEESGGDRKECPAGVETQSHANRDELYTMPQPNSENYSNSITGPLSNDSPSSDNDTQMYSGEESQTSPTSPVNSSEAQKDNLLEDPTFQSLFHTARGTPQSPSPGVETAPQSLNAKGNGPLTLDHPVIKGYLKLVPHLQHIIKHILKAEWYKKRHQEPAGEEIPGELDLQPRQSSTTPISLFGVFFSARQPYDCLLCPKDSPKHKHKRTLERALGHARDHFNFKPIQANQKTYTNLNTKNDQERRALNPAKFCIPCEKRITRQNWKRHAESKAHTTSAAGYPENEKIWRDSQ